MSEIDLKVHYKMLVETIRVLSLPYEQQKQTLPNFVDHPFEVIDDFEQEYILLPYLVKEGLLNYDQIADIMWLYIRINLNCRMQELTDLDENTFANNENWNTVRKMADKLFQKLPAEI